MRAGFRMLAFWGAAWLEKTFGKNALLRGLVFGVRFSSASCDFAGFIMCILFCLGFGGMRVGIRCHGSLVVGFPPAGFQLQAEIRASNSGCHGSGTVGLGRIGKRVPSE